jgi:hypothetical protein
MVADIGDPHRLLHNVLDKGSATIVTDGRTYEVHRPEVIPMAEATACFRTREQRMHRQFHVDATLRSAGGWKRADQRAWAQSDQACSQAELSGWPIARSAWRARRASPGSRGAWVVRCVQ